MRIIILLCVFYSNGLVGQIKNKATLSDKALVEYRSNYEKKLLSLDFKSAPSYYFDRNVNIYKIDELKKVGVDLYKIDESGGRKDYKESVVLSDLVVKGTIVKRYYTPQDPIYRTTYEVKVEKFYKGLALTKGTIVKIKMRSGMSRDTKGFIKSSHEYDMFLGEKVILYLLKLDNFKYIKEGGVRRIVKDNVKNSKGEKYWILKTKLNIKSDYVIESEMKTILGKLSDIESDIEIIKKINNKS